MKPHRRTFLYTEKKWIDFMRKVTHKVIENGENSEKLEFTQSVENATKKLLDGYIDIHTGQGRKEAKERRRAESKAADAVVEAAGVDAAAE